MKEPGVGGVLRRSVFAVVLLAAAQLSNALATPSLFSRGTTSRDEKLRQKRSADLSTPSAISIAPSQYWEGNDGPWSSFPLQAGTGAVGGLQNVRVMVSTAATAIWTIGALGCPADFGSGCANSRGDLFLTNESLTWAPNSIYQTGLEMNLGLDSSGNVGYDVATFGWQGSGGPKVDHSIIWNLADGNYWLGVFGLNPRPTNFTSFTNPQTSFIQTLVNDEKIPSTSWAYTAGNQYRLDQVYGSLTLGGYDSNRFIPNNVTFPFNDNISRDLSVNLHSITTSEGSPSNLLPDGSISIFIDSTIPELWLPESACQAFEDAFGIEYNTNYGRYLITPAQREKLLAQNAEIKFTISPNVTGGETVDITLPYQAFDLQVQFPIVFNPNTSYYFPLMRAANDTQYTLGRMFLQEAYLIADYDRQNFSVSQCRWEQEKVSTQNIVDVLAPDTNPSKPQGISTAAIVGVAVGVAALIGVLGLILLFLRRKKNAKKHRLAELKEKNTAGLTTSNASSSQHIISVPMGGELGGGEIHELPLHGRHAVQEIDGPYGGDPNKVGFSEMEGQAHFGHGKDFASEMPAHQPVYEMAGTEVVSELPSGRLSRLSKGSRTRSRSGWI